MQDEFQYKKWIEFAAQDLGSAKHLLTMRPVPIEVICYLCEQSVEKLLKAVLLTNNIEAPKIHDLRELCRRCMTVDDSFRELAVICSELTPYAVQVRYPEEIEVLEADMLEAITGAEKAMAFIEPLFTQEQAESMEQRMP